MEKAATGRKCPLRKVTGRERRRKKGREAPQAYSYKRQKEKEGPLLEEKSLYLLPFRGSEETIPSEGGGKGEPYFRYKRKKKTGGTWSTRGGGING